MAERGFIAFVILILFTTAGLPGAAGAEEASFTIARFVMARDVVDLEPVGEAATFRASVDTVYAFLDARDIKQNAEIAMAWYYEGEEVALVTLLVREAPRWRTFSMKTISGQRGRWAVALKDAQGKTLRTINFTVK